MKESQLSPHYLGAVVSTATRFSDRADYQKAVEEQLATPYLDYYANEQNTAYSFKLLDYTEELLIWQPTNQEYITDCRIQYVRVGENVPVLWAKYHWLILKSRYEGLEGVDESLPGVNDAINETRRVVFKDRYQPLKDELGGYIINPPYPPFAPNPSLKTDSALVMTAGIIIGAGILTWILTRRRHHFG